MKFKIYKDINKFYFTNNVIASLIFAAFVLIGIIYHTLSPNLDTKLVNSIITNWLFISVMIIVFLAPIFLKLHLNLNTYQPLKGSIEGYLELNIEKITVDKKEYSLDQINKIEIWNFDFVGDSNNYASRFNFNGLMSNGIENLFEMYLHDSTVLKIHFQQDYGNQIIHAKQELFNYYKQGKIDFSTLARILDCKNELDRDILKRTLTANSR